MFEDARVNIIDVTGGMLGFLRSGHNEPGFHKALGIAAKSAASVTVIITGGVIAAHEMEDLLKEGAGDLIGVGRALLTDADWAEKALNLE